MFGFPSMYVQMKDRPLECGPATYVPCEFRHPTTKTQRSAWGPWPWPAHHWKGYQSIQWRPRNPAVLWQRKNRSARRKKLPQSPKMMQIPNLVRDCAPRGNSHCPNQLNSTTLRVASQGLASPPKEEWFRDAHRGPPTSRHTNTSKSAREIFTAILYESHRLTSIMTQIAKDQEMIITLTKIKAPIKRMLPVQNVPLWSGDG